MEGENWELLFNEHRVSVWEDFEKGSETDGGDYCTAMRMYLMPMNCLLKSG